MAIPLNLHNGPWEMHPSEDDDGYSESSSDSSSDGSSSDEEPPAKTRTRRSDELACSAAPTPDGSLSEPFQSMMTESFNNVVLSDITIFIKGLRFPAHSFVLAAQCDYFKDALTKGGLKKEAIREFHFDKWPPHAYWRMLEYLYKGTYSVEPVVEFSEADDELIHRHIHAYAVAEAFGIERLQRLATSRFKECMKGEHMDERFVECVRLVFRCTKVRGNMLRREVMDIVGRHSKTLWGVGPFQHLVRGGQDFAVDFAAKLLEAE